MRIPDHLNALIDEGIIDEVVRPLMSGKEAQVYLLRSGSELRVAKVYKLAQDRTFKQRAQYTEGRKVRNSRDQRAMNNRSRHGREQDEAAWRATEVDVIHRLHAAGVRVPIPYQFIDGVLIMELVTDADGSPAPRLGDVSLDRESALQIYDQLLREVVRMLCAGIVHGDLSDFNVLLGPDGPVIIDFPQAVNAASNQNARRLLLRDVDNLHRFRARFAPEARALPYAEEMWQLYERGELTPDTRLVGRYRPAEHSVDTDAVLGLIADAEFDEHKRRAKQGGNLRGLSAPPRVAPPMSGQAPGQRRADASPARQHERPKPVQQAQKPRMLPVHARGNGPRVPPDRRAPQPPEQRSGAGTSGPRRDSDRRGQQPPQRPEQRTGTPAREQRVEPNRRGQQPPQRPEQRTGTPGQAPYRGEQQSPRRSEQRTASSSSDQLERPRQGGQQAPQRFEQRNAGPAYAPQPEQDDRSRLSQPASQTEDAALAPGLADDASPSSAAAPSRSSKRRRRRRRRGPGPDDASANSSAPTPAASTDPRKPNGVTSRRS